MKVSVIIATYRRARSLRRTLASITDQTCKPEEVIVVDQSPGPERSAVEEVVQWARAFGLPVRLIYCPFPSSTRARNLGLADSTGDWVVFSDDDVDWKIDALERLRSKVAASSELVMVAASDSCRSGGSQPIWRRIFAAMFFTNTLHPLHKGKVFRCMQAKYPQPVVGDMETEWAMGFWFAADRHFIVEHRLTFDEQMTRYAQAEDMLFSHQLYKRAQLVRRRCIISEHVVVAHLVTQEWREADSFADLCNAWNRIYIASVLCKGLSFWVSLAAIYWAAVHQALVRIIRGRGWLGHLRAHAVALFNLPAIRAGDFERLYVRYERRP
jgi:glycosyltransferase involved in cell wall biosynthesis